METRRRSINLGFELCTTDLLEQVLARGPCSNVESRPLVRQLASAVAHLHSCDIVHLDIKLENILLDQRGQVRLGDLGVAEVRPAGTLVNKECGSAAYAAPEVLLCKELGAYDGRAADCWSLGVSIFTIVSGRYPYCNGFQTSSYKAFVEAERVAAEAGHQLATPSAVALSHPIQREAIAPSLLVLLDKCLNYIPSTRSTAADVCCCTWLQNDEMTQVFRRWSNRAARH